MNGKDLFWLIPLCVLVFGSIGYVKGNLDGANMMVDKCNAQYELANKLCDLECALNDGAMNMWEYYEIRCPEVYLEIQKGDINLYEEWEKYGINNSH